MQLIECVPNFSTSDPETISTITSAINKVPTARVLNVEADPDYNRVVITYIVSPEYAVQASINAIRAAIENIDMRYHTGQHPRIGAVDVFPFVPYHNVSTAMCITLVEQVAKYVGAEMKIPVYLYGKAAKIPERRVLARIRRGEYEGLRSKLRDPAWQPDFGPAVFNEKSGAVVLGVRDILVAYNIHLKSNQLEIASNIARIIRESGGIVEGKFVKGRLKGVQALGVSVTRGGVQFVQVTTNILDYKHKTPLHEVYEHVRQEAKKMGVDVAGSEIVGLVPLDCLLAAGEFYCPQVSDEHGKILCAIESLGLSRFEQFDPAKKILDYLL